MRRRVRSVLRLMGALLLSLPLLTCALHVTHSGGADIPDRPDGALRVASHNVHYILLRQETGDWSVTDWHRRKGALDAAFKAIDADIVAFQEMESFAGGSVSPRNLALDFLLAQNPGYGAAAQGDPRRFPSTQPIFYRKAALRPVDQGWFFFSDTPGVLYSRTFNGSYPAFASWAAFETRSDGRRFTVFNVHYEYKSRSNRLKSAALTARRMAPRIEAGQTVFLVGDLNARPGADTLSILERTGLRFAPLDGATYHLNRGLNLFAAIDHLAATPDAALVGAPVIVQRRFAGEWPSDHYPVFADYVLR
ncbi:endonuclease/exonuclease/phosphatase family protein [Aestuariicoccus sp. MJ-SS9]|uniref:endonuclease/exonuclease/phosphatase family protein n=1 Tax=Aestuariicoccus sp. MJ-SS9 TaxID=3079855 RepID=UPI00290924BC|nr:endonuclease/exonuclease/phosphatase family protein [Aestuariicoccus sp. MJ-SS9]MDU8912041.1 endonuclease/exonuclease/phosphatase family protein [Aestuariicoccus sp. MJ-SS9]